MTHAQRYMDLAAQLDENQRKDNSYQAALYLLAYDDDLARKAKRYISHDGINFPKFRTDLKKDFIYDDNSSIRQVVEVAYSLFSWKDSKVNAHEMANLSYPWLELTCTAMYLQSGLAELAVVDSGTDLVLDFRKAQKVADWSQRLGSAPVMGRINEQGKTSEPLTPLESLCAEAKAQAAELNGGKAADDAMQEPEQTQN